MKIILENHKSLTEFGQFGQRTMFLKAQKLLKQDPTALIQWLNNVVNGLLCSGKYQNVLENHRNETLIRNEYQNLLGKLCSDLHDGKSLLEAVKFIQNDSKIMLNNLRAHLADQNQIQKFEKMQLLEAPESWFVSKRDIQRE